MRPPRIAILALFFAACVFLLCRAVVAAVAQPSVPVASSSGEPAGKSTFRSLFSFSAPFTLFPPNAIITIADDNSTSFAARPAAFGPSLPKKGLRGQLWVGSGFTEEAFQDGEGEGELGCSDVPGWEGNPNTNTMLKPSIKESVTDVSKSAVAAGQTKLRFRRSGSIPFGGGVGGAGTSGSKSSKPVDDGTDDYLHHGLSQSGSGHADIQSIQEGAEIAGKIVLLSRGGCGFLEKVKWAQRRGAIGVIVGDNQRGGPLIQMFAHGDTSNVTIPSIFTSRTTAYLLSLMMQPGSFIEDIIDENGKPSLSVQQQSERSRKAKKARQHSTSPTPVPKDATGLRTGKSQLSKKQPAGKGADQENSSSGWFSRMFSWGSSSNTASSTGRSSANGKLDWVLVEEFSDEKDKVIKNGLRNASKGNADKSKSRSSSGDDFQIGVEDWRDPDLVGPVDGEEQPGASSSLAGDRSKLRTKSGGAASAGQSFDKKKEGRTGFKGSSKTSGTGEYTADGVPAKDQDMFDSTKGKSGATSTGHGGLLSKLFGNGEEDDDQVASTTDSQANPMVPPVKPAPDEGPNLAGDDEGLWVVITPSSGASPFFDTLLVLVISPLITLTVVYALLILRARIRRRRWRAPKSVVDRLPVRTYHTVASSDSSRAPSPTSSSPTTPLLQDQRNAQKPRPRSRTTTGVPSTGDLLQADTAVTIPRSPSRPEHEKRTSEWKKYMGRQVECAVCLEEYVNGVSKVMSLPCGHEFHVDCITPWLTTRRRTCPICKGDVVRSLARGSPSTPRYEPYHDDSSDEAEAEGSGPEPDPGADDDSDLEQGVTTDLPYDTPRDNHPEGWLGVFSGSFRLWSPSRSGSRGRDGNGDR
ncbi:hypothetical protein DL764_000843 [Monosporascus ibericus]|uniref:RING-type domain-containing protein n=1 Tax=Monosporascus ibericus TaxID=155417 RepID=A0A4Q4TX09_9PEZI|nr:hypothetical protein DL764_000843 [Monosporascus ibericus]